VLRANPNPPQAALAPHAATNKDKEPHHQSFGTRNRNSN
jgi:hypothetical protein